MQKGSLDKYSNLADTFLNFGVISMRITVDIDEKDLASVHRATGIHKRSPAVRQAIADYVKDMKKKRFLRCVMDGKSDYALNNDELEARDTHDAD